MLLDLREDIRYPVDRLSGDFLRLLCGTEEIVALLLLWQSSKSY